MNLKLQTIYNWIEPTWKYVVDVGCDHAYLSLNSFLLHHDHFFYNLDNKMGPLTNGQKLQKNNPNALFHLSNGLDYLQNQNVIIDCCVIAGMGGLNILKILENNRLEIPNFILQPDNNWEVLEEWLIAKHYMIVDLKVISEQNHSYWIYKVKSC